MKKYNEKMIVRNGKMVYAISLEDKNNKNSDRTHLLIDNGQVYFTDDWYNGALEFDFNDEAHKIAKEIFVSQLQVDIKRRILELKQLEEIFESLGLKECLGNSIYDNSQKLLEIKEEISKDLKKEMKKDVKKIENKLEDTVADIVEENVRPIAIKKPKKGKSE